MIAILAMTFSIFYFYYNKEIKLLLLSCVLFLVYFELKNKMENNERFTTNEAIQNLASMYNSETITCKNLKVLNNTEMGGALTVGGNTNINGNMNFKDGITLNGKMNITGVTEITGNTNITGKLTTTDMITSPRGKFGKIRLENNIVGDEQFHITNKNGTGTRLSFANDGNIVPLRCDGWTSGGLDGRIMAGWGNGYCPTKPNDSTFI